jgi:GNAT superfamily N-acetyltransferase
MHTAEAARRKGAGSAILEHIISVARSRGISRLSLETGSWDYSGLRLPCIAGMASSSARHSQAMCPIRTAFS